MTVSSNVPIAPGMRVLCRDAEWLVTKVEFSDPGHEHHAIHCIGSDDLVRGHESVFLTQLDTIEPIDPRNSTLVQDSSSGFRLSKLFLEAQLRQMPATGVEPDLENMGVFEPMPFQIQTVDWALKQLRPRLLLADAVGLGKTIQVGMILSELMRRGRANRILVLAKKSMLTQFQSELWNRFGIPLVRLDSAGIARLRLRIPANKNPFEVYHRVIISIDTLKNVGSYRHFLENTRWDCVVIDEAHNVAGASVPERHLSNRLARLLSRRADSMLLTTATPHNGRQETFGRLISLLDPSAIPDPDLKEYSAEDIKGFFFMRFKEDVKADVGANLPERMLVPLTETTASATGQEEAVYAELAELRKAVKEKTDPGLKSQALLQYGIYKQFLSSPESCLTTVSKRKAGVLERDPGSPEIAYLERIEGALTGLSITDTSRYQLLVQQLREIGWDGGTKCPRVLVFTEYRPTQDALAAALSKDFGLKYDSKFEAQPNQPLATINGSYPDIHLMKTVEAFGTGSSPIRMLLTTDVASEGINLHHECHNIIHYDLPWSIITLIQRNGRIDRFGQTENPVLRYLLVKTEQGLLEGDEAIFNRLITKVEEINKLRCQGETVLKLYDSEAEERYIAESGVLPGNVEVLETPAASASQETSELESMLSAATPGADDDYLKFLLGEANEAPEDGTGLDVDDSASRLRLYKDRGFLLHGYRFLREQQDSYVEIGENAKLMMLTAPKDLRRRLGAPNERGDVVFGATAIPMEAWPEDNLFRLTDDVDRVSLAIKAARNTSGYWAKELYCSDQHPILQWVTERLLMLMRRGESPYVTSRALEPGELCFCFIGQVSSRAGSPLVVDAHAISFRKGGGFEHRSLNEALEAADFQNLINEGKEGEVEAAQALIPSAVEASLIHLRKLRDRQEKKLIPFLRREERRLRNWKNRRDEILEERIAKLGDNNPRAKRYRKDIQESDGYLKDRSENWRNTYFTASTEPSTRLVLVIEGTD